jgi:hypothetical protein
MDFHVNEKKDGEEKSARTARKNLTTLNVMIITLTPNFVTTQNNVKTAELSGPKTTNK